MPLEGGCQGMRPTGSKRAALRGRVEHQCRLWQVDEEEEEEGGGGATQVRCGREGGEQRGEASL